MAKPSEPKKPAAKVAPGKAATAPAKAAAKKAAPPKAAAKPAKAEAATKPTEDHTKATGRDHPSQSEHAKALWQKLHGTSDQRTKGGPPGAGGKKGFDPNQLRGGKGGMAGGHNQMLRRTQGKGGGGGGGGGGGQV